MRIKICSFPCDTEIKLIEKFVQQFFKKNYPITLFRVDVFGLPRGRLEIIAYVDDLHQEEKQSLVGLARNELCDFLKKQFGYEKPFFISLHSRNYTAGH